MAAGSHPDQGCIRVSEVRTSRVFRVEHAVKPEAHQLQVAFNNRLLSSDKSFDGKAVAAIRGRFVAQSFFLPAGSELTGWSVGQVDYLKLEISPLAVRAACDEAGQRVATAVRPATPVDDPVIWHLACALRADLRAGCPGGTLMRESIHALLARHIALVHRSDPFSRPLPSGAITPARLRSVCDYIQANLHGEIRLAELAILAGVSKFHFARAFKLMVHVSPYQYVLEKRLEAGSRLLVSTSLSIAQIAAATGFVTAAGFAASFRRRWALTPRAYRRAAER